MTHFFVLLEKNVFQSFLTSRIFSTFFFTYFASTNRGFTILGHQEKLLNEEKSALSAFPGLVKSSL